MDTVQNIVREMLRIILPHINCKYVKIVDMNGEKTYVNIGGSTQSEQSDED